MSCPTPWAWLTAAHETIKKAGWQRQVQTTSGRVGPCITLEGQAVLNFASNNYLGLAGDERLIQAATEALALYGTGSTGSRLLSGQLGIHQALEAALAQWKGSEAALVFSSGYLANLGTVSALVGPRDLILADAYNHSSLKSGAILSQAAVLEYAHGDVDQLAQLLDQQRGNYRRCLILTDSIFSMDGDAAPLGEIQLLADHYDAMLLVDEAHGTGVLGPQGAGLVAQLGLNRDWVIQGGTLSKSLGSLGGYVCGPAQVIDYLRHRARSWVYSTGLSAADTAAALTAIQIIQTEPQHQAQLWERVIQTKHAFEARELKLFPSDSAILCWDLGTLDQTVARAEALRKQGIFAPAIRPPTVPTSRIRFSLMATHTSDMIDQLLAAIDTTHG